MTEALPDGIGAELHGVVVVAVEDLDAVGEPRKGLHKKSIGGCNQTSLVSIIVINCYLFNNPEKKSYYPDSAHMAELFPCTYPLTHLAAACLPPLVSKHSTKSPC